MRIRDRASKLVRKLGTPRGLAAFAVITLMSGGFVLPAVGETRDVVSPVVQAVLPGRSDEEEPSGGFLFPDNAGGDDDPG